MFRSIHRALVAPALFAIVLLLAAAGPTLAQAPGMMGSWVLDPEQSQVARGRAGGPGPTQLIVKVSDADVTVVSDTGTNRARETTVYRLDGAEHEVPGPQSWTSMAKAAWEGDTLVVTIARIIEGPTGPVRIEMKDVYGLEGDALTIERTQGNQTWKSVFHKR